MFAAAKVPASAATPPVSTTNHASAVRASAMDAHALCSANQKIDARAGCVGVTSRVCEGFAVLEVSKYLSGRGKIKAFLGREMWSKRAPHGRAPFSRRSCGTSPPRTSYASARGWQPWACTSGATCHLFARVVRAPDT